ncbi:GAP family protein [Conexibacter stalactiti]|uniref:GAP family protein n=1 Tax=Conexibacter stalactiti TaxID=1940611 RepID=A0ABU4HID1_9ACTN|nr:GAP family protein [Conexibacter stalactiti]MDW5593010.1 GAP family protein [Conexibacter stalactiti]MEC5033651.1 GAP family protein [Conexibacter stalactiti]
MLNGVIGELLPAALAVALSPVPVVAVVSVLGGRGARTSGLAFACGWIAGLLAIGVAVELLVDSFSDPGEDDPGLIWWKVAIGILFLVLAAKQWTKRPESGEQPREPGWMATLDGAGPVRAVALGAMLSAANPKNLALTVTAGASIAEAGLDATGTALSLAVFAAVGSITVAGPVLFHLVAGERAARPLAGVKRFMADNDAVIKTVVLLLLGAMLLGDGLAGL